MEMTISMFAKKVGTTVRTLRYYDQVGLLTPERQNENGHKLYTRKEWERYQQIQVFKHLGFSLADMKEKLKTSAWSGREMLVAQKNMLEQKKRELEEVLATIRRAEALYDLEGIEEEDLDDLLFVLLDAFRLEKRQKDALIAHFPESLLNELFDYDEDPDVQLEIDKQAAYFYKRMKNALHNNVEPGAEEVQSYIKELFSSFPMKSVPNVVDELGDIEAFFVEHERLFFIHFPERLQKYMDEAMEIYFRNESREEDGT
ncbi:MerR family transcriptional regulator [Shouchella clausii]|uniref:MerR family transcriptional regulator n=1 Tax=Shouchella clausii TaxID=79880 RepID=UPI000BA75E4E|nr:MerR family transcriptional regulator [Shouchella clausii]PAD14472.1 hypothetical protein CHH73_17865 [Shouchella clausii]